MKNQEKVIRVMQDYISNHFYEEIKVSLTVRCALLEMIVIRQDYISLYKWMQAMFRRGAIAEKRILRIVRFFAITHNRVKGNA